MSRQALEAGTEAPLRLPRALAEQVHKFLLDAAAVQIVQVEQGNACLLYTSLCAVAGGPLWGRSPAVRHGLPHVGHCLLYTSRCV